MTKEQEQFIKEFENMRNLAELNALSKYSLENELSDEQFNRMTYLIKGVLEK